MPRFQPVDASDDSSDSSGNLEATFTLDDSLGSPAAQKGGVFAILGSRVTRPVVVHLEAIAATDIPFKNTEPELWAAVAAEAEANGGSAEAVDPKNAKTAGAGGRPRGRRKPGAPMLTIGFALVAERTGDVASGEGGETPPVAAEASLEAFAGSLWQAWTETGGSGGGGGGRADARRACTVALGRERADGGAVRLGAAVGDDVGSSCSPPPQPTPRPPPHSTRGGGGGRRGRRRRSSTTDSTARRPPLPPRARPRSPSVCMGSM